jgi:hypothetical protein
MRFPISLLHHPLTFYTEHLLYAHVTALLFRWLHTEWLLRNDHGSATVLNKRLASDQSRASIVNFKMEVERALWDDHGSATVLNQRLASDQSRASISNFTMEVEKAIAMKTIFWHIAWRSVVQVGRRFRDAYCLHNQGDESSMHLWNVDILQRDHTALYARRLSSYSSREPNISQAIAVFCIYRAEVAAK